MDRVFLFFIILGFFLFLLLIFIFIFRQVFVLSTNFGSYTAPTWTACSASQCGSPGTQQLVSYCIVNSRTGLGCVDFKDNELQQTLNTKIYDQRTCTGVCPSTMEIFLDETTCVNNVKTVRYQCRTTGQVGPTPCVAGTVRSENVNCL